MHSDSQRGSVILVVTIFSTVLIIILTSLLGYVLTEKRINQANILRFQSKNAAEAVLEYAASEISARLATNLNFSSKEFIDAPVVTHVNRRETLFASGSGQHNHVNPDSIQLFVASVTAPTRRYVDPNNPGNDFDPLRSQFVTTRSVRLLSTATATFAGRTAVSRATQAFEIRDAALFNYAIFYNMNMEFHPAPSMTVVGPVHSNENIYLTEGSGLSFLGNITTAGTLTVGTIGGGRPSGRNISFFNGTYNNDGKHNTVTVNNPTFGGKSIGTYIDSFVHTRGDKSHNFRDLASQIWNGNVQDISHGVLPQTPPGMVAGQAAYQLIQPPNPSGNESIEKQKFSNQAGLYAVVEPNGRTTLFPSPDIAETYKGVPSVLRPAWIATNSDQVIQPPNGLVNSSRRMYDHREKRWINTVDFDLSVLNTAIRTTTADAPSNLKLDGKDWNLDGTEGWNGIFYVDVVNPAAGYTATSDIGAMGSGSGTRTAVRLLNGTQLPNRRAVNPTNSTLVEGMTFATNAPVYVVGHYNADGVLQANLSDMTQPEANESPAAIVADAINILSQGWLKDGLPIVDEFSASTPGNRPSAYRNADHTEISAAFLTGIVTTAGTNNNQYSGGVENYPRFHENWSNRSLRYRGSIVAMFESEVATARWSNAQYSPPRREWGFNQMFADGRYPAGTPIIRTYRRLDYRDLNAAEFNALRNDPNLNFTSM